MQDWIIPELQLFFIAMMEMEISGWVKEEKIAEITNITRNNLFNGTGADYVQNLGKGQEASEFLQSLGIPGIRYLDQGSRASGKGTYNYVVFPGMEKELKIMERR